MNHRTNLVGAEVNSPLTRLGKGACNTAYIAALNPRIYVAHKMVQECYSFMLSCACI